MKAAMLSAVAVSTLLAGCAPPPVAGGVRNDRFCPTCYESRRDNPLLQGSITLGTTSNDTDVFTEESERNLLGFSYYNFRFDGLVKGDSARGATRKELNPNPATPGSWSAPGWLPWDLHGIELGYSLSEAFLVRGGATGSSAMAAQIGVSLDPTVMLVPIQVIRVIPDRPDAPFALNLQKYTKAVQKKYWDDEWDIDTSRFSHPDVPNKGSVHAVNETVLPWDNADEIWEQCGIQFRMITCPGSGQGCPDLTVSDPALVAATSCFHGLGEAPEARDNWNQAAKLPGVTSDLPIITFAWRVSHPSCDIADVAEGGRAAMAFGPSLGAGTGDLALAHELGHVLGLHDAQDCTTADARHLMCTRDGEQTRRILPGDCQKARSAAAVFVKRHWGVEVTP